MPDVFDTIDAPTGTATRGDVFDQIQPDAKRDIFDEVAPEAASAPSASPDASPDIMSGTSDFFDSGPSGAPSGDLGKFLAPSESIRPSGGPEGLLIPTGAFDRPFIDFPTPKVTGPISGFLAGGANLIKSVETPGNALLAAGLTVAPEVAAIGLGARALFGIPMIKQGAERAVDALSAPTTGEAVQAATEGVGSMAMGALGLKTRPGAGGMLPGETIATAREARSATEAVTNVPEAPVPETPLQEKSLESLGVIAHQTPITSNEALGQMAKGVTENLYKTLFSKLEIGDLTEAGQPSSVLQNAKPLFDSGKIKSPEELRSWVQSGQPPIAPQIIGPALAENGGIVKQGKIGETHAELKVAAAKEGVDATEADHVFTDSNGDALTREEAYPIAEKNGQLNGNGKSKRATAEANGKQPQLESQDLTPPESPPVAQPTTSAPEGPTGIRNAIVDQERVARGLPERMGPLRRSFGKIWDEAMAAVDKDPAAGTKLVDEIAADPRPLEDWESALLAHEQVTRQNVFDQAVDDVNSAPDGASKLDAQARLDRSRDDVQQIYDVGQNVGTKSGQSLAARKLLVNADFSLARMEAETRAVVNDGQPLSSKQAADVKALHERIAESDKKIAELEARESARNAADAFQMFLKEQKSEASASAKRGKTITSFLDEQAAKAKERIIARRGRLNVTVDPLNVAGLVDEAIIGASYIAKGVSALADWSKKMVDDFGERIRPYLNDLFERSKQLHDANVALFSEKKGSKPSAGERAKANAATKGTLDPKIVYDLAREKVNDGLSDLDSVMKAVHEELAPLHPGLTERQVRDAFSGYGKLQLPSKEADLTKLRELRRLGQLVSAIEDAQRKEAPKKSGMQRDKPTQAIRDKIKELHDTMRELGIETSSPEQQLASANQGRATSLRNQIEDLDRQLRTGEKRPKGKPAPDTPEVERLRSERDALKEKLNEIENPPKSEDQTRLERDKKAIARRTEELKKRIAAGDYGPRAKKEPLMDAEKMRLLAENERAKAQYRSNLEKARLANRTKSQKFWDAFVNIQRGMKLSSDVVLAKLTIAAVAREAILTPAEELTGAVISKVLPRLAAGAPREGRLSFKAEIRAKRELFTSGMKDAWDNLRMRKSDLESVYGKKRPEVPPAWYDYFGFLHGALKAPVKRAEFARSLQKRMESAELSGLNLNDQATMLRLAQESYIDANRAIFMQDNVFSTAFNGALRIAERSKIAPNLGPVVSRLGRFLVPIVKVPTNIVGEVSTGIGGTVSGSVMAARAYLRGIDLLPPAERDVIMRHLKKGSIGAGLMLFGYFNYETIGGYYSRDDKRSKSDVQPGRYRIAGWDAPKSFGHSTGAMLINVGASIHREQDARERKVGTPQAVAQGARVALTGVAKELPFVRAMTGVVEALDTEQGFERYIQYLITGTLTPGLFQHAAKVIDTPGTFPANAFDEPNARKPSAFLDAIKMGIPGLRQDVPLKKKR